MKSLLYRAMMICVLKMGYLKERSPQNNRFDIRTHPHDVPNLYAVLIYNGAKKNFIQSRSVTIDTGCDINNRNIIMLI